MADRVELLKAMRVLKEHCKSDCFSCEHYDGHGNCEFSFPPYEWYLEDGEANEG